MSDSIRDTLNPSAEASVRGALDALRNPHPSLGDIQWYDDTTVLAVLERIACPIVCVGYLDGDENWHQRCINKARAAMEKLAAV